MHGLSHAGRGLGRSTGSRMWGSGAKFECGSCSLNTEVRDPAYYSVELKSQLLQGIHVIIIVNFQIVLLWVLTWQQTFRKGHSESVLNCRRWLEKTATVYTRATSFTNTRKSHRADKFKSSTPIYAPVLYIPNRRRMQAVPVIKSLSHSS